MFAEHPVIGVGIGNYNLKFKNFYSLRELISRYDLVTFTGIKIDGANGKKRISDPHSLYMGTLAEQGILGLFALAFFFGSFYKYIYSSERIMNDSKKENVVYILTAGLTGFLLNGLTTDILTMRHFWFLMAIIISFISICKNEQNIQRG